MKLRPFICCWDTRSRTRLRCFYSIDPRPQCLGCEAPTLTSQYVVGIVEDPIASWGLIDTPKTESRCCIVGDAACVEMTTTRVPVARKHADDSMLMQACVEFIAPGKVIDYEDWPICRLRSKIRVEPRINTRGDPREGLLVASGTEPLSLPGFAIIHHQMQRPDVGAVV